MTERFFITGTDTDCGKTHATGQLVKQFEALGKQVMAIKPVASGCMEIEGQLVSLDALQLAKGNLALAQSICPWRLREPLSPHLAARHEKKELSVSSIIDFCLDTRFNAYDTLLIEGAGGLMAPLTDSETWLDVLKKNHFKVVLVVGMRLGCINHALMTVELLKIKQISLQGWIANHLDPTLQAAEEVQATLTSKIAAPLLMTIPYSR